MGQPQVYSVLTANGLLGGVGVWSLRLSEFSARREGLRWVTFVLCPGGLPDQLQWFVDEGFPNLEVWPYDPLAKKGQLLDALVHRLHGADVVVPNYVVAAWDAAARLKRTRPAQSPRVLGVCHSDHPLFYQWLSDFAPSIDLIVAVSEYCLQRCRSEGGNGPRLARLPYGVPVPDQLPSRPDPPPLRLVYLGRISEHQKRVSLLVELCRRLDHQGVDFRLDLFGTGPDEAKLRAELSSEPRVVFHGPLRYGEVAVAFRDAHVQVLLSDHEGLPIALLEGMAYGTVPVATAVSSGVPELVIQGRTGFVVPVTNPLPEAVKVLTELARSPALLKQIGQAAHEHVKAQFDAEQVFPRWLTLVGQLANEPPVQLPRDWTPPQPTGFGRFTVLDHPCCPGWLTRLVRRLRHSSLRSAIRRPLGDRGR